LGIDIVPADGAGVGPEGAVAFGVGAKAVGRAGLVFAVAGLLAVVGVDAVAGTALAGEDAAPTAGAFCGSFVQPKDTTRRPATHRSLRTRELA
jgi:hypothetical protein